VHKRNEKDYEKGETIQSPPAAPMTNKNSATDLIEHFIRETQIRGSAHARRSLQRIAFPPSRRALDSLEDRGNRPPPSRRARR